MKYNRLLSVLGYVMASIATTCHAGVNFDTPQGKLSIGGNFEFNFDVAHLNSDTTSGTDTYINSGRVELNINGERDAANGMYGAFSFNPGWQIYGDAINDQWMGIGKKDDWFFKMGHYLAVEIAPIGLGIGDDTWIGGYEMYTASDARGRASSMATFSQVSGPLYYEVTAVYADDFSDHESSLNTLPGQSTAGNYLYDGSGITAVKHRDPFVLRPVVSWKGDHIQAIIGGEFNIVSDAYVSETNQVSLSKRNGIGGSISYVFNEDWSALLRSAYLDGVSHTQFTFGPGIKYKNIYVAYLFGHENIMKNSDLGITQDMQANAHELYVSSVWKNFIGLDNLEFHAGGYWTQLLAKDDASAAMAKPTDYGARFRIKYWF